MNTVNKVLLGALGVQVVLALFTNRPASGPGEARDLLGFPTDQVKSVTVTGRKTREDTPAAPLTLARAEGDGAGWVIASAEGYPAKDDLVQPVIDALGKLKVHLPIASSPESQVSLEVADDTFTRTLEVTSKDGQTKKLFLGAAQGKTTHVRLDGEKEVYDADGFTAWSVSENANRYFDRDFLKVDPATVSAITIHRPTGPELHFTKDADGKWTVDTLTAGQQLDPNLTANFVASLLSLRMADPAGKTVTPEMGLDGPNTTVVTWTATPPAPETSDADGSATPAGAPVTQSYRIGAEVAGQTGRFYLKSDTNPFVVQMLKGNVANAVEKTVDKLLVGAAPDPASKPPMGGPLPPGANGFRPPLPPPHR